MGSQCPLGSPVTWHTAAPESGMVAAELFSPGRADTKHLQAHSWVLEFEKCRIGVKYKLFHYIHVCLIPTSIWK